MPMLAHLVFLTTICISAGAVVGAVLAFAIGG